MTSITTYGDISPRTAAFAVAQLLKRGMPYLVYEKFGQTYPIPRQGTKVAKFRRYYLSGSTGSAGSAAVTNGGPAWGIPLATTPLVEGVTPAGRQLLNQDYTVTLQQFGDFSAISDVIIDTHEDPVLAQMTEVLGEQAALTLETVRFNVLKAGTNVFYSNGVARTSVNTPITLALQRSITTALNRQQAKKITSVVASTPDFNTKSVEASFIAIAHPDLESGIRAMTGFKPVSDYGPHTTPMEGEVGSVEQVRYLLTTVNSPWESAGGAYQPTIDGATVTMRSANTTNADVYPVLFFGRDAYGIVPLKGGSSVTPMVVNPKPASGDPLGQRGTVGWKAYMAASILNDGWMARLECSAVA